ncbi:MAG: DUF1549 and DUF1553 domain-containing protein [Planctomycetota bacterium]
MTQRPLRARIATASLLCVLSVLARALDREPGRPDDVLRLEVFPTQVTFDRASDSAQLLVTGVRRDGLRVDLTRVAVPMAPCPELALSPGGLMRPQQDGQGALQLAVGEHSVEVSVRVTGVAAPLVPSFIEDVLPILSRSGCNAGTCHGSAKGKNGFKLSLRGYDPAFDHDALTDDLAGRRFNRSAPDSSLFLQKPTGAVPHEGGQLVAPDSVDYAVLRAWVRDGARLELDTPRVARIELIPADPTIPEPGMSQQFAVLAHYTDGRVRDVTAQAFVESGNIDVAHAQPGGLVETLRRGDAPVLARYEGRYAATRLFVMGDRSGFAWRAAPQHNYIDELVDADLQRIRALPSELCTDAEFVRRLHLDLTGLPPSRRATEAFLLDQRPSRLKREELIDRLIGGPEFVEHWANRWADLLQVNSKFLGDEGAAAVHGWLRGAVASNMPYDRFVRELLTATGSTLKNPPAAYFKVLRDPDAAVESTTQLFLGIRFNCNKCHDHPFERWTQEQHWQTAAWFSQVRREDAPGAAKMASSEVMKAGEAAPAFEELISDDDALPRDVSDPDGRRYLAQFPYTHAALPDASLPLRAQLADWLTAPTNPYFALSYANRVWSYFLGIGLIEPVDDLRAGNPASNPELLQRLTEEFLASDFDTRALMRTICRSRVYQQSVRPNEWNADDEVHFSHALPRRLPAETLYDALHQATGSRPRLTGVRRGTRARDLVDAGGRAAGEARDGFLGLFGRPPRESVCECERSAGTSLGQALNLVNGPTLAEAIEDPENSISSLVATERDPVKIVSELYMAFLCRPPTAEELAEFTPLFDTGDLANLAALRPEDRAALAPKRSAFEAQLAPPAWTPLALTTRVSEGGATFEALADGSVLIGGAEPERDVTTLVAFTDKARLTGLRLEALADPALPAGGPGRAKNGNFVLQRVTVTAVSVADPSAVVPVKLIGASADYSQDGFDVSGALRADGAGWAVSGALGQGHAAWFDVEDLTLAPGGTLLVLRLEQGYGATHTLGRVRVSVTDSTAEVRYRALPELVAAALATPSGERSAEQEAALFRHFAASDEGLQQRLRLGGAQDLAWALATSSAFLFNR